METPSIIDKTMAAIETKFSPTHLFNINGNRQPDLHYKAEI